jgi:hypothetical protein
VGTNLAASLERKALEAQPEVGQRAAREAPRAAALRGERPVVHRCLLWRRQHPSSPQSRAGALSDW